MPLTAVNSVTLRPDRLREFEEAVAALSKRAVEKNEKWRWTAHQVVFGDTRNIHFVYDVDDFGALQELGTVDELWQRVLGEKRGAEGIQVTNAAVELGQHTISIDRPDLSYPPDDERRDSPYSVVTVARMRPGRAEAAEELIRKVAEAIPKTEDAARMSAYEVRFGEIQQLWTVRPLASLSELDQQKPAPDLLIEAFGPSEGGLIWRTGTEAIETATREIVAYREDLSNPPRD
jgi:hypothetical protein